jgi:hypothetical protein
MSARIAPPIGRLNDADRPHVLFAHGADLGDDAGQVHAADLEVAGQPSSLK